MKTYTAKPDEVEQSWYVVDAQGKTLGRLASKVAHILRGKHKPNFTPHVDVGDHVIIVNAHKVHLTGKKLKEKEYRHHTGYPGGVRSTTAEQLLKKAPEKLLELAIKGMLPKNRLGRSMFKKLKVYAAAEHPHAAQLPRILEL